MTEPGERPPGAHGGVLRRAQITLIGSVVGGALAITSEILCARYLGARIYGLYALALILARVGEAVSVLGLRIATLHFLPIYRDRNDPRYVLGTIWASLLPPLVLGVALAALMWLLAPTLALRVFGDADAERFLRAMALAIPLLALSEVLAVITRGFGHAGYYVVARSLAPPVVFFALLLLITTLSADALWIPVAFCAAYLVATAIGAFAVRRVAGPSLFAVKPAYPFRALYTYSLPILVNNLLYLVIGWTDILMLGVLNSGEQVGIYRACMQIVMPFDMIVLAFNAAVGHLYPVLAKNRQHAELAALVAKITRWMSMLALTGLLMIALNRHDLLLLMGPEFAGGADALVVLALGHAALCCIGSAGFLLVLSGHQKTETFNALAAAVLNIALNVLLIPRYGIVGAAASTCTACLFISVLRVAQVRRLMAIRVLRRGFLRILALAAVTALATIIASAVLPIGEGRGIAGLVLRIALIGALFATLYWFAALTREERSLARGIVGAAFGRKPPAP